MSKTIKANALTREKFKDFGTVISAASRVPDGGDRTTFSWWERFAVFEGMSISINLLECKKREMLLDKLERHSESPEVIIPMGRENMIICVAPPGDLVEEKIAAFILKSGEGVILGTGVWHFVPLPIHDNSLCAIVFKDATGANDLLIRELAAPHSIAL